MVRSLLRTIAALLSQSQSFKIAGFSHITSERVLTIYSAQAEGRGPSLKCSSFFFFPLGRLPVLQLLIDKLQSSDVLFNG